MTVKNAIYKVDDGKGSFDEIYFKTIAEQVFLDDNRDLQSALNLKEKLWEGAYYMSNTGQFVYPKKHLDKCLNGWVLIWSDYNPGSGVGNYNWFIAFIPKTGAFINSGNVLFSIPNNEDGGWVIKALYIKNDRLEGGSSEKINGWNDVVLREVWEC